MTALSVFISYSRRDGEKIARLERALTESGYDVWIDRSGIEGGSEWRHEIVTGIETADVFLLAMSRASMESRNVRREIDVAEGADRKILPILLEPVALPSALRYQLSSLQMLDMPDFTSVHLAELFKALGGSAAKAPPPPQRQVADLSATAGGGLLNRIATGRLFKKRQNKP